MTPPDFHSEAVAFSRKTGFVPACDIQAAMEHGAELMAGQMLVELRKLNSDLSRARESSCPRTDHGQKMVADTTQNKAR